jgi:hypothetical protein
MADIADKMRYLINALRGRGNSAEGDQNSRRLLDQRRRGYQLYVQESKVMGEPILSYEEWIRTQE